MIRVRLLALLDVVSPQCCLAPSSSHFPRKFLGESGESESAFSWKLVLRCQGANVVVVVWRSD